MKYLETLQGVEFAATDLRDNELKALWEQGLIKEDYFKGWALTDEGKEELDKC